MISLLSKQKLVVNWDESSFSRSVRSSYSWLPKVSSHQILNLKCKGLVTIISGVLSNGDWIALAFGTTAKSKEFWLYLAVLEKFLEYWIKVDFDSCYIILDNASTHLSRKPKAFSKYAGLKLWYIPPYSPELTPVELMFGAKKKYISYNQHFIDIHFGESSGSKALFCSLSKINNNSVNGMWRHCVEQTQRRLMEAIERLNERSILMQQVVSPISVSKIEDEDMEI